MKAFPWHEGFEKEAGMDLRDYFAAKVIIHGAFSASTNKYDRDVAKRAYEIADAMMVARNANN